MPDLRVLIDGVVFGEQPRWHDDRLWFSDWGTQEVIAVDLDGNSEVMLKVRSFPLCVGWLPDGRLLIVSMKDRQLLRREPDGTLVVHGDLSSAATGHTNDMAVDAVGRAYVGNFGFDLMSGSPLQTAALHRVDPDGTVT